MRLIILALTILLSSSAGAEEIKEIDDCGCGCCYEKPMGIECVTKEKLEEIKKKIERKENLVSCSTAGCSAGTKYKICSIKEEVEKSSNSISDFFKSFHFNKE